MDPRQLGLSDEDLEALGYTLDHRGPGGEDDGLAGASGGSRGGRASRETRGWAWTVVLLLAMAWAAGLERRLPDPVPANRPDAGFSSARAMSQLVEIARRPRPPGSPEHRRVRTYLVERLRSLGFEPEVQTVTSALRVDGLARVATLRNVLVRIPGTDPTGAVAVIAHYDSRPLSPGAGDGGVGVAAVLETVRALSSDEPLRNDVVVVLADGHGVGISGTRAFVDRHPWARDVGRVISVEMLGVSGPALVLEKEDGNQDVVRTVAGATPRPVAMSLARELPLAGRSGSLLTPFLEAGVPGLALTSLGERDTHGQATDRAIRVSERTLQHHGVQLLALVREYGGRDLGVDARGGDEAYVPVPLAGMIHYPLAWTGLLSGVLLGGWVVLVGISLWRRKGSHQGILAGAATAALSLGATALAGWGLLRLFVGTHPEYGHLESAFYQEGRSVLALAAVAVTLVTAFHALARRWFAAGELFIGAVAFPLGAAVWLGLQAPFAAVALQWPAALGLLSAVLLLAVHPRRLTDRWVSAALLLGSGAVLVVMVPHLELIAAVLTFREAPLIGGFLGLGLILILPPLERLRRPRGWWTPAAAALVAAVLLVLDLPSLRKPESHPVPSSLLYLVDDTLPGITPPPSDQEPDTTAPVARRMAGRWLLVPGPGEDWARSWVVEEEAGSTAPGVLLLSRTGRYEVAGAGPEAVLSPPWIRILDAEPAGRRRLRLALRSGLGGEMVGLHLPAGGTWESVAGVELAGEPGSGPVRSLVHWGERDGAWLPLDLRLEPGQRRVEILILEHHLRPEEVLGEGMFRRNASFIPDASTESDRVIQRTHAVLTIPGGTDSR